MSKFKALCKALASFDTTGAEPDQLAYQFYDASIGYQEKNWIKLAEVGIDEASSPIPASAWDRVLNQMMHFARRQGSFDVDMDRIPLDGRVPPKEMRRINLRYVNDIDMLDRICVVIVINFWTDYCYVVRFSSETGLPNSMITRIETSSGVSKVVYLSGQQRKELKSFAQLKEYF